MHLFGHQHFAKAIIANPVFLNILRLVAFVHVVITVFDLFDKSPITSIKEWIVSILTAISIPTRVTITPFPPWVENVAIIFGMLPGVAFIAAMLGIITEPTTASARKKMFNSLLLYLNTTKYLGRAQALSSAWIAAGREAQLLSIQRRRPLMPAMHACAAVVLRLPMVVGATNAAPVNATAGHSNANSLEFESLVIASIAAVALIIMAILSGAPQQVWAQIQAVWQSDRVAFRRQRLHVEILDDDASDLADRADHETENATAGSTMPAVTEESSRQLWLQWQVPGACILEGLGRWFWQMDNDTIVDQTEEQPNYHLEGGSSQSSAEMLAAAGAWVQGLPAERVEDLEDDDLFEGAET